MSTFQTIGARATGLATIAADGTVLDTWYPSPELVEGIAASSSTRLTEAIGLGAEILAGQVRGRVVVNVNA